MSINAAWKDSYILTWENFVNICELQFGYLDYILGDFKDISNYSKNDDVRYYSFLSELSMGIIIAILNNNRKYENENWYDNDTSLITQSDDLDKIFLWITKNNRTKAKKYIICNLLSEEIDRLHNISPFYEPNCVKFVKSEKEIPSDKYVFRLNIDEYIKCLDFMNFKKGNYTIEKI